MNTKKMTIAEIENRFAKIDAQEPITLTDDEAVMLAKAEAMDDGTTTSLEDYKKEESQYNGKFLVRLPHSLHKELAETAKNEGVSLNQYMLYKLSR